MQNTTYQGKSVLVTTVHRGVFFGTLIEEDGDSVVLENAQNCVYWSVATKGFLGLAASGPRSDCKIGPPAQSLRLLGVTSIAEVSEEAAKRWRSAPWS